MKRAMHESFDRAEDLKSGSDRAFGAVFTAVFGLLAVFGAWHGAASWPYSAGAAVVFAMVTLLIPSILAPLNSLWMRLALLLSRVITPVVMAILFFGTVLPTGIVMRLLRKDPLRLKWQRDAKSYWVPRDPPELAPDSLKNQF